MAALTDARCSGGFTLKAIVAARHANAPDGVMTQWTSQTRAILSVIRFNHSPAQPQQEWNLSSTTGKFPFFSADGGKSLAGFISKNPFGLSRKPMYAVGITG